MPLIKVAPKLKTEKAEFFTIEGRYVAIIRVPGRTPQDDIEMIREVFGQTLDMDVIVMNNNVEVEILEVLPQTRRERLLQDDE